MSADGCAGRPSVTGCLWTNVIIFPLGTALNNVHLSPRQFDMELVKLWVFVCLFFGGIAF